MAAMISERHGIISVLEILLRLAAWVDARHWHPAMSHFGSCLFNKLTGSKWPDMEQCCSHRFPGEMRTNPVKYVARFA